MQYLVLAYFCLLLPTNSSANDVLQFISPSAFVNFAVVDHALLLSMSLPVKVAVGFDLPAKTNRQRSTLSRTSLLLEDANSVLLLPDLASCKLITSEIIIRNLSLAGNSKEVFEVGWVYHCKDTDAITEIEINLFRHFPQILNILLVVPPDQQHLVSATIARVNF